MARKERPPDADPLAYVLTPAELAGDVYRWLGQAKSPGWRLATFGHRAIDQDLALYPGSLTGILGRPSMGKSLLCKWLAKREASRIAAGESVAGGPSSECVVYVTLEETPEVIGMALDGWPLSVQDVVRGNYELDDWTDRALRLVSLPVYMIRHPGVVDGKLPPALTPQRLYEAISRLSQDFPADPEAARIRPTLVILDYVQLLQGDNLAMTEKTKTAQVTAAIEGAKNLAVSLRIPVIMAVQAGRQTDHRRDYMPTMGDAQWASAIEQACDAVLGVHRPIRREDFADQIRAGTSIKVTINGRAYDVTDRLMVIGLVKQRAGTGAGRYPVYLDPVTLTLHEMEREDGL